MTSSEPDAQVDLQDQRRQRSDGRLPLIPLDRLKASPSRADGISAEEETRLRSSACSFIARAGKELQFKQLAIATACVYFHTFFVRYSFKAYDRFEIAAVCLFLAGKVEEQRRKVKDVAEICLMVRHGRRRGPTDQNVLKTVCDSILDRELLLLSVVEFQFHPAHPYQYCMMVLKRVFQSIEENHASSLEQSGEVLSKMVQKEIAQYAWLMINDSLRTTLCLQFKPEPIALACIDAAFRIMNLDRAKPIVLRSDWFTEYVPTATAEKFHQIWCELLEVVGLESSGPAVDSHVLWERFRKVVSSTKKAGNGAVSPDPSTPCDIALGTATEAIRDENGAEISDEESTPVGENDHQEAPDNDHQEAPDASSASSKEIATESGDQADDSTEPLSKKIRTE